MTIPQELQAARLLLVKERPYLAAAAWALQPIVRPGLKTLAVDMYWRLYFDPEVFCKWTVELTAGVLYHEICHLLRNHAERMKNCEPKLSNMATDAEINDDLLQEKVKLPTLPLTPATIGQPDHLLAEQYYAALEEERQKLSQGNNLNKSAPDTPDYESSLASTTHQGDGSDNVDTDNKVSPPARFGPSLEELNRQYEQECYYDRGATNPQGSEAGETAERGHNGWSQSHDNADVPTPGSGHCGSCATGQAEPWEEAPPNQASPYGLGKTEGDLVRREVAKQIREYSLGQGRLPGHWLRWAEERRHPQVDWRRQLAAALRFVVADTNGATDYSYRRPSRRQGPGGLGEIIFPALRRPVPSIAIVADTSASISDNMLAQTLAEITGIIKGLGQNRNVYVIAVDQTVHSCRQVFRTEQIILAGGGGTNMGAGMDAAAGIKPLPQIGIVITDGLTAWPENPPRGMNIIVVLSGEGSAPTWARVIKVSA